LSVTTPRLRGEPLGPGHHDLLLGLLGEARVAEWLWPDDPGAVPREIGRWLAGDVEHWERHGFGYWLWRERTTGEPVGRGGLKRARVADRDEVEVGWVVRADRWGQGYATELAEASISFAFARLGLQDVVAFTLPHNAASRRVMEKTGFEYERDIVHHGLPHVLYRRERGMPET
jgi:RimJ/RimL family protein N-acetyltransferase